MHACCSLFRRALRGEHIEGKDDVTIVIITVLCGALFLTRLRAGQNVCLHTARRNSGLPVLINTGTVFVSPKTVLRPPPQAHLSLCSDAL